MCRILYKKIGCIGCKIIAFEVKKKALFTPHKTKSTIFESSWLKTLAPYKVEALDIMS
jgi:hypothetical protein